MSTDALDPVIDRALSRDSADAGPYIHLVDDREGGEAVTIAHEDAFMSEWVTGDNAVDVEGMA